MKNLLLIIIFSLVLKLSFSQDPLYKVFFFDGEIQYKPLNSQEWMGLESLDLNLAHSDSLYLAEGSYLYLVNLEGRQVYLEHPGKYQVINLAENTKTNNLSLFARYAEFVWAELGETHKDIDDYADRQLKEKGGVSRAVNIPPIIFPYYGSYEMADEITFQWENSGAKKYVLSFWDSDMDGKWFGSFTTDDTLLMISTKLDWIPLDSDFYFTLTEKGRSANNFIPIRVLSPEKKQGILEELDIISRMKANEQIKLLMTASMFEENYLFSEAENTFQRALELNPRSEEVLLYYGLFKARRSRK